MKKLKNNNKDYIFVNEVTIDGVTHTLFRRPNKDCREVIEVKGKKYIAVDPDVTDKYIIVSGKKKRILKKDENVQEEWLKIIDTK